MSRSVADLKLGEQGMISGFLDDVISLKLMEMGCLPGVTVKLNFKAPLGDPIAIDVAGYSLSLRMAEATNILIES